MSLEMQRWTPEEEARLVDLVAAGTPASAIAAELGRSVNAINIRRNRLIKFDVETYVPGFGKGCGPRPYWTEERVRDGLADFALRNKGALPNDQGDYSATKKNHPEWPPASAVTGMFGSMANAWDAIGQPRRRVSRQWNEWTQADDDYLLEHAGTQTLAVIGRYLGRSAPSLKRRLYDLGAGRARDVSGHFSLMQVAREYQCPLSRVKSLVASGRLPARKVVGGHYWRIAPEDCEKIRAELSAPKRTYTTTPPDFGEYDKKYGLRRVRQADGSMARVARTDRDGMHVPVTKFHPYARRFSA